MSEICGCCQGIELLTPVATANRPGLRSLTYRMGTHGSFLTTMLARLTTHHLWDATDPNNRDKWTYPLLGLKARTGDDPAIALLDGWATVADVLTFYQERIANEGYLRTATERRSVLELARLVGYTLRPGVAASLYLAYTLDKDPTKDTQVRIPRGSRVQSVPGPGELPQTFETAEDVDARYSWNNFQPRLSRPTAIELNADNPEDLYFEGITTNLKPNDPLLLVFGLTAGAQKLVWVKTVTPEPDENRTAVELQGAKAQLLASLTDSIIHTVTSAQTSPPRPNNQTAATISGNILDPLLGQLDVQLPSLRVPGASPDVGTLVSVLQGALAPLREQLEFVTARNYGLLRDWLEPLVNDLTSELEQAQRLWSTATAGAMTPPLLTPGRIGPAAQGIDESCTQVASALGGALGALTLPPSLPPPGAHQLRRSVQGLFAPCTDLAPRLLAALNPTLGTMLDSALSHLEATTTAPLQSVQALRVKAAPFGATAPLKPVLDSRGLVVGTEEWPLGGTAVVGVRMSTLTAAGAVGLPASAQLFAKVGDVTSTAEASITMPAPNQPAITQTIQLPPGDVIITASVTQPSGAVTTGLLTNTVRFDFQRPLPLRSITVTWMSGQSATTVTLDGTPPLAWTLSPGQSVRAATDGHRVTVELTGPPAGTDVIGLTSQPSVPTLTITDESLLPPAPPNVLALDAQYDQITPGSWVVIERPSAEQFRTGQIITQVTKVETVAKTAYGISAKVTQLTLADSWLTNQDLLLSVARATTVYAQSEPLALVWEPVDDDIMGQTIDLDQVYSGLNSGRWLIVSGERTDIPGTSSVQASELVMLAGTTQGIDPGRPGDKVHSTLLLANGLAYRYKRRTATVWGNVVKATHGETRNDVLGSGVGNLAQQTFTLRQSPLTYLAAANPLGAQSTLEVRVNDVRWHEADSLVSLGPTDHGYIIRTDDNDKTSAVFGNGVHGARLPTGIENVKGVYRTGIGKPGNVKAEQITQLQSRPLGVNSVINPLPATGGADREGRDQARRNTPLGVMALDRLVSVQDYEDFTRSRAGIGKASARRVSDGSRSVVHVTIAGADDIPIDPASDLFQNLLSALYQYGDPHQPLQLAVRERALLIISARVHVDADHLWELVEPKVRAAMLDAFGFDRRELGQDVLLSEVISTIQALPGVAHVEVDAFGSVSQSVTPQQLVSLAQTLTPPPDRLRMQLARFADGAIKPAQLAILSPAVADTLILKGDAP